MCLNYCIMYISKKKRELAESEGNDLGRYVFQINPGTRRVCERQVNVEIRSFLKLLTTM